MKLNDSHSRVHGCLTALLVIVAICLMASFVLLSLFFTNPAQKEWLNLSAIPFYVALLIITGFFIYVSPGLLDRHNGIEFHQFLLICIYLIFLFAYPVLYTLIVLQSNGNEVGADEEGKDKDPNEQKVYDQKDAYTIFIPLVILFSIHLVIIGPIVLCGFHYKKGLEALLVGCLIAIFALEIRNDKDGANSSIP